MNSKPTYQELEKEIEILRQKLEISERNEKFKNFFDYNKAIMLQINTATKQITKANKAALNFYGYSESELLHKTIRDLNTSPSEKINTTIKEVVKRESNFFEFQHKLADGKIKDVEVYVLPFDIDGEAHIIATVYDISDRKRSELALKASEGKLQGIMKSMTDIVFLLDKENRFVSVNTPSGDLYLKPEMFLGKKHSEVIPKHVDDLYNAAMINVKKGKTEEYEYYLDMPDKIHWFSLKLSPVYNNGKFDGSVSVVRDITDRKKAELELKESEEKYRLITENASDVIWILNITLGKFTYISSSIYKLRGYTVEEALQQDLSQAITPEFKKEIEKNIDINMQKLIANSKKSITNTYEIQQPCKDGRVIWVEISTRFQYNSKSEIEVLGISRNIDVRKKIEQALKESEEKYKYLIENQGEGFGVVDTHENFIFVNPMAEKIFGVKSGKLTGENLFDFFDKEQFEIIKEQSKKREQLQTNTYELVFTDDNKQRKNILITATPDINSNGKITGTIGIFRDITDRKKAELELKESEKKLKESNKTKDKFFSIIAHDLRSPFSSMLGFSELLDKNFDKYDTEKKKKFINIINQGLEGTFKLLENLLTWSRSQRGIIDFNPKKVNLYLLTYETSQLLIQSAEKKSIELINQIDEDIYIEVDQDMFSIIIRNLISNAIKFTPKDGKISITAKNKQKFIEITVKDSGVGISKQIQTRLFDITENTSTEGTEQETGTGLGLILCKEFVEKHGGKIWVESEDGKGSEFIFTMLKVVQ